MVSFKLSGLVALTGIASVNALNFNGVGQLRLFDWKDDSVDLGCVTNDGLWTYNEADCGTFTGVRNSDSDIHVSSATGNCYMDNITFDCASGGTAAQFRLEIYNQSPTEALGYGEYGLMAAKTGTNPKSPSDPAVQMIFTSYSQQGDYGNIYWKAL